MATEATSPAIALRDLRFAWSADEPLLSIDKLAIERAERVFLRGPSGSGKSTLLELLGGVLTPDAGLLEVLGRNLGALRQAERDHFRAQHVGFIFQQFNLLPYLGVMDNVLLSCRFSRKRAERASGQDDSPADSARRLLATLRIDDRLMARPVRALSIGQQQRVAAARALIGNPEILIADEPTSALDHDARGAFLALLLSECARAGTTLLFVSHDPSLARWFDRELDIDDINAAAPAHG